METTNEPTFYTAMLELLNDAQSANQTALRESEQGLRDLETCLVDGLAMVKEHRDRLAQAGLIDLEA